MGRASGKVDMADYIGAALGSLITSVILVPRLGISQTLMVFALVKLSSLTLLTYVHRIKFIFKEQ